MPNFLLKTLFFKRIFFLYLYKLQYLLIILLFIIKCNYKSQTNKTINFNNEDEIDNFDKIDIFKELDLSNQEKANFKELLSIGGKTKNIFDKVDLKNSSKFLLYKKQDVGNSTSSKENKSKLGKWLEKIKLKIKNKLQAGNNKSKHLKNEKKVKKFIKKFNKKYKGWMILITALASGIILILTLLAILSGGIFFVFIAILMGISSFRLFTKLKEEYDYTKASFKKNSKNQKKKKKNKNLKQKNKKKHKKIEIGFFLTLSFIIALILSLSFLGFIGIAYGTVFVILAGLTITRILKLFLEGRIRK